MITKPQRFSIPPPVHAGTNHPGINRNFVHHLHLPSGGFIMQHTTTSIRRLALGGVVALLCTYSGVAQAGLLGLGGPKDIPVTQINQDIASGNGSKYYKNNLSRALAKSDKIFIGGFQVRYIVGGEAAGTTAGSSSSRAAGGGYIEHSWRAGQNVSMKVNLQGVSDKDLQQLTDRIYADFTQQLATTGLKVIDAETVRSKLAAAQLKTAANPYEAEDTTHGRGVVRIRSFAPTGMPLFFRQAQGNMGIMSRNNDIALGNLSHELNAVALFPVITLSMMKMESSGNHIYIPVDASVSVEEAAYVSNVWTDTAMTWYMQDNGIAYDGDMITLKDRIVMSGSIGEFVDVTSDETKANDDTLNSVKAGLSIVSGLLGAPTGGTMSSHQDVELRTTPEKLAAVIEPGAKAVNRIYIDALTHTGK
ncbi:hypothetical protein FE236_00275 [Mariprofundus erugo]|uniref:hypothetical protein n=1 Tax=Mariprofundus erugo TaxID=2528639 RepID=UPI0010FE4C0A|nr:hypothetical protein [Mariprofundus erugo]TLS78229.1 hypothetical protein FE236_00275 [Mariprofundus erugo]